MQSFIQSFSLKTLDLSLSCAYSYIRTYVATQIISYVFTYSYKLPQYVQQSLEIFKNMHKKKKMFNKVYTS